MGPRHCRLGEGHASALNGIDNGKELGCIVGGEQDNNWTGA